MAPRHRRRWRTQLRPRRRPRWRRTRPLRGAASFPTAACPSACAQMSHAATRVRHAAAPRAAASSRSRVATTAVAALGGCPRSNLSTPKTAPDNSAPLTATVHHITGCNLSRSVDLSREFSGAATSRAGSQVTRSQLTHAHSRNVASPGMRPYGAAACCRGARRATFRLASAPRRRCSSAAALASSGAAAGAWNCTPVTSPAGRPAAFGHPP
jgi:hypothetical protein